MPNFRFTDATPNTWLTGLDASSDFASRTLHYSGFLGGGHLIVETVCDGVKTIVPEVWLDEVQTDFYGVVIRQKQFWSSGIMSVTLVGASHADAYVAVR